MSTALQLRAALRGDFDKETKAGLERVEAAIQAALFEFAGETQSKWRQDILGSGLANAGRLSKTVRVRKYRNKGLDPAAMVYSSFPILQRAFEQGAVVRSREGLWLTIPNPEVWPHGRVRHPGGRGQQRQTSVAVAERRFGRLRFIYRPNGVSLLVTDARKSKTRAGTFRYASPTATKRGNVETIVVFFLVKEVRLPRMLRGSVIRARARANADTAIDRSFVRHFERGDGPALLTGATDD